MKIGRKHIPPLILLLASVSTTAYATTSITLFTHTFPGVPTNAATCSTSTTCITTLCATLVANIPPDNTQSYPAASPPAAVAFDCGPAGVTPGTPSQSSGEKDAINATMCIPNCNVIPQFTLPSGYSSLIVYHPGFPPQLCSPSVDGQTISSNVPVLLTPSYYEYCAIVSNPPSTGLQSFSVNWSTA